MDGWKKKKEGSGERKGGETQIRARAMMWQQTKPPPPRRGRRGRNGQRGRDRWDERGESGVNGWDTNRAKDIAAHGQSRGTEGLEWTSRPGRELSYGAGGWMPFSASCKMDKAGKLPRIFSDYSIYSGIKGEAWYRLSESAEIDWALTTKQLFVRRGQGVADRWPPAQSGIKARSSRVQGHGSAAHQQGRRPRHNNVPQAFFFFLPPFLLSPRWVWSSEYSLVHASPQAASERQNEWPYFEAPKEDKFVFPHVRRHSTSQLTDNKRLCLLSDVKQ